VKAYKDTKKFIHPLVLANSFNNNKNSVHIKWFTTEDFCFGKFKYS